MLMNAKKGLLALLLFSTISCKKNAADIKEGGIDQSKVYQKPITYDQIELVSNLEKTTIVLQELYKQKNNLTLVNAAIYSKAYTDESVLLKDLINPAKSILPQNKKFQDLCSKWGVNLPDFSSQFWTIVNKKGDATFQAFLVKIQTNHLPVQSLGTNTNQSGNEFSSDDVSIYFPYSDQFDADASGNSYGPITSLVAASAEADEALGVQPVYRNGELVAYNTVVINDEYAFAHPTQIIGINGIEPIQTQDVGNVIPIDIPPTDAYRVYVGDAICQAQYDRLISFTGNGGGSEIEYCRVSGYLKPVDQQITEFEDQISVKFERGTIRKKQWLRLYAVWDDDWTAENKEQVFAIFEEDNNATITFTGSLTTSMRASAGNTVSASADYQIKRSSQDAIIRQLKMSRVSYFLGAQKDQGWGFGIDKSFLPASAAHGWPFYDAVSGSGANVGWTWPFNHY